jgi:hypothetical protein
MLIGACVEDIMSWLIGVYVYSTTGRLRGIFMRNISSSPMSVYIVSITRRLI